MSDDVLCLVHSGGDCIVCRVERIGDDAKEDLQYWKSHDVQELQRDNQFLQDRVARLEERLRRLHEATAPNVDLSRDEEE